MQKLSKFFMTLAVVLILGAVAVALIPQWRKHQTHERRLSDLRAEITREEMRLQDLRVRQDRFQNDPNYVRRVAHEIGLVEPHEVVLRFYDESRAAPR